MPESQVETSLVLLTRAQAGDEQALNTLLQRYLPRLKRWITGRLPPRSRSLCDSDDLVQDTLIAVLRAVPSFEIRHDSALQAYLKRAVWNRLREEVRKSSRMGEMTPVDEAIEAPDPSPLEKVIGAAAIAKYERALERLSEDERSAVVGRLEFGYSYPELALMLGKGTPDAARKLVERALPQLAAWMRDDA